MLTPELIEELKPHEAYGGIDLASVADLSAFGLAWPIGDFVFIEPWFWLPEHKLAERCKRDSVDYERWAREGYLELTPSVVTDWRFITAKVKSLAKTFKIKSISYDPYNARDTIADLVAERINCVECRQGFLSLSPPTKLFEQLILSRKLIHTNHPILRWNLQCCSIMSDPSGNLKPCKPHKQQGGKRIDGIAATIDALYGVQGRPVAKKSVYSKRGLLLLDSKDGWIDASRKPKA